MKFINGLIVLCLLLLTVLTSCKYLIRHNEIKGFEQEIEEITLDNGDLRDTMPGDFSYDLLKPLISSKGVFNYRELELPSKINDLKMAVWLIFDKQRLIVVLYEENPSVITKEIGFYNFITNEYEKLFNIQKDGDGEYSVSIYDVDESNILYLEQVNKDINDLIGTFTLRLFNIESKKDITIHEYSRDYSASSAANSNKVILHDGMVYYDEVKVTDGEITGINLYQYDLKNETTSLVKEWAQNPTIYNGSLFTVVKDVKSSDFYLQSIDEKTSFKLNERISDLASTKTELYVINNKYFDEKNRYTVWNIENLISGEELLTSTIAIDRLNGNNEILTWTNFFPEKPVIYLKALDKFIIFNDIEKGYFSYKFSDEFCILSYSNDYNESKYYIFELI